MIETETVAALVVVVAATAAVVGFNCKRLSLNQFMC